MKIRFSSRGKRYLQNMMVKSCNLNFTTREVPLIEHLIRLCHEEWSDWDKPFLHRKHKDAMTLSYWDDIDACICTPKPFLTVIFICVNGFQSLSQTTSVVISSCRRKRATVSLVSTKLPLRSVTGYDTRGIPLDLLLHDQGTPWHSVTCLTRVTWWLLCLKT